MSSNDSPSSLFNLTRMEADVWSQVTPVNCAIIRSFGIFLCIASFVGIICNGALICSFIRYKSLLSPPNVFVMFIAGMGFLASCTLLPLTGTSSVYCQWLYGRTGCYMDGIMGFLYGCASSYLLCAVSASRCYIIVRPFDANKVTVRACVMVSCGVVLLSFMWTMMPLLGWNEYTMEVGRTSCCIDWYSRRPSYLSFTVVIFVFVYCVPLVILVVTNSITLHGLQRMHEKIERGLRAGFNRRRIEMERRILKSITITTCGFFITWTPYAVSVLITMFQGLEHGTPPIVTSIASIFAKSSAVWIPLLYICTSTQFHLRLVNQNAINLHASSNEMPTCGGNPPADNRPAKKCKAGQIAPAAE